LDFTIQHLIIFSCFLNLSRLFDDLIRQYLHWTKHSFWYFCFYFTGHWKYSWSRGYHYGWGIPTNWQ